MHLAPARRPRDFDDTGLERQELPAAAASDRRVELEGVAWRLRALAESFATLSESVEAAMLERFQAQAAPLVDRCGDMSIRDTDAERLSLQADGSFSGEVVLADAPTVWRPLTSARDIVNVFDPSDLFADLAERLLESFPSIGNPDDLDAGPRLCLLAEALADGGRPGQTQREPQEVSLIERFQETAATWTDMLGDIVILDDSDEHLTLGQDGRFLAEVVPEDDEGNWRTLRTSEEIREFYSPEELFQALADTLRSAFPAAAIDGPDVAAATLHDLTLLWRELALDAEATLFDEFNRASVRVGTGLGEFVIVDDDDERLVIDEDGQLQAWVLDRSTGEWQELGSPDDLVQAYDPTDVFADLADALADAFPGLAVENPTGEELT